MNKWIKIGATQKQLNLIKKRKETQNFIYIKKSKSKK